MAGRPEKYTEKYCLELGRRLLDWMAEDEEHIFVKEFLIKHTDVDENRISELVKKFDSFSGLIKKAKGIQEMRLVNIALKTGKPIGAIFLLKNHHGYADKQEVKTDAIVRTVDAKDLLTASDDALKDALRTMTDD